MSETLTVEQSELIARIGAELAGGRHAFRITDESIRANAARIVEPIRKDARRAKAKETRELQRLERDMRESMARLMRESMRDSYDGYSPELELRIENVHALFAIAPRRAQLRVIAKALFTNRITDDSERAAILKNWRTVVRKYIRIRDELDSVGAFPISRNDMRADSRSRFYRSAVKHWHNYTGGRHGISAIYGATPDDAMQDGFLAALQNGDYVTDVRITALGKVVNSEIVPTYGAAFRHVRNAVEAAPFAYRHVTDHSDATIWNWSNWEEWATNNSISRAAYSTLAEWQAYDAARELQSAIDRRNKRIADERIAAIDSLSNARRSFAQLILTGMPVSQAAKLLGRTVKGILTDIENEPAPVVRFV